MADVFPCLCEFDFDDTSILFRSLPKDQILIHQPIDNAGCRTQGKAKWVSNFTHDARALQTQYPNHLVFLMSQCPPGSIQAFRFDNHKMVHKLIEVCEELVSFLG